MVRITGPALEVSKWWGANSGSGGGTGPKLPVRFAHWLTGTSPPNDPGSPLGPGGRWKAFKAWLKKLAGLK